MRFRSMPVLMASLVSTVSFGLSVGATPAAASGAATPSAAVVAPASAYVPLATPTRLLDTRTAFPAPLGPGGIATVTATAESGIAGLPLSATTTAVVLNITVVGPAAVGFWTVYPNGSTRPNAANLNVDERASALRANLAMPNLVTVPVGPGGKVDVFTQTGGNVVVDMLGSYQASEATAAGRLQPLATPSRILDTRTGALIPPVSSINVAVPNAGGASAAVLTVTTIASNPGYWTVYPTGTTPPLAANLNSLNALHIVANQVIVPLDATGTFSVFSQSGGHAIIDLVALVTGPTAPVSTDGLFVPLTTPTRFLDTRDATMNPLGATQSALPGWNLEVPVATNPAINRPDVAAVAVNLTVTEALTPGYVTVSPAGANDPADKSRKTATLNIIRAAQTLPNHAIVGVSSRGFDVFTQGGAQLIADVSGYYLGTPLVTPFAAPKNVSPTPAGCVGFPVNPVSAIVTGSSPGTVIRAQQRLIDLGFWVQSTDGSYGLTTSQAVMAFQKWNNLPRTTVIDETTAAAMNTMQCRPTPGVNGDVFEVDKGRQLGFIVRGGKAQWVINISSGGNYDYVTTDRKTGAEIRDKAITPSGSFKVYRVHDEVRYEGSLGTLYRPRFFVGGVAVHGYGSIPGYAASHGCVRVSNPAMDLIWGISAMPMGSTVVVHD